MTEALGISDQIGTIEIGKLADMILIEENPLQNLKVLYGTEAIKLTETNEIVRLGGVRYTIKDGIPLDATLLLQDIKEMVARDKEEKKLRNISAGFKKKLTIQCHPEK